MKRKLLALILALCLLLCGCEIIILPGPVYEAEPWPGLFVHYIGVGQADCILVECEEAFLLIDGGNGDDGRKVVAYLQDQGVQELQTVICTHPHEDHVGGLPAVLAVFPTGTVYSPSKSYSSKYYDDFMHYVDQQGLEITLPTPGSAFYLGSALVELLGPLKSYPETNDTSIVTKITYGETVFLFTGDMEVTAENDLIGNGTILKADVLKVGHHGSNTSTGQRFLQAVSPMYGVISLGKNNDYGHPHKEPMARLEQTGVTTFRTDLLGTVLAISDGEEITFRWENQQNNPSYAGKALEQIYIGNRNSHIFHTSGCGSLPTERNRAYFATYEEAIRQGYTPCRACIGGQ